MDNVQRMWKIFKRKVMLKESYTFYKSMWAWVRRNSHSYSYSQAIDQELLHASAAKSNKLEKKTRWPLSIYFRKKKCFKIQSESDNLTIEKVAEIDSRRRNDEMKKNKQYGDSIKKTATKHIAKLWNGWKIPIDRVKYVMNFYF